MLGTFLRAANLTGEVLGFDVRGGRSPSDAWLPNFGKSEREVKKLEEDFGGSGLDSLSLQQNMTIF